MVGYIEGTPRYQIYLFKECLNDMIDKDNIVRFIDAYVESLDMEKIGFKIPVRITGTPPYYNTPRNSYNKKWNSYSLSLQ